MITQTLAIFLDAYRELNSRKLFWITLIISAAVMGLFAVMGVSPEGLSFFGKTFAVPFPYVIYKTIFATVVFGAWLTFVAMILGLISTASLFPDMAGGGAVELYLARPISRPRLFLTKYFAGLLFVVVQVVAFSVGAFLVLGLRGGLWEAGIFLAIPLVAALFSYLYAVSVLIGVLTRSALAAILITMAFWFLVAIASRAETSLLTWTLIQQNQVTQHQKRIDFNNGIIRIREAEESAATQPSATLTYYRTQVSADTERMRSDAQTLRTLQTWHGVVYWVKTVLPKSADTSQLIERVLFTDKELAAAAKDSGRRGPLGDDPEETEMRLQSMQDATQTARTELRRRSLTWIIGTSLAFEATIVALAAVVFCRRDY